MPIAIPVSLTGVAVTGGGVSTWHSQISVDDAQDAVDAIRAFYASNIAKHAGWTATFPSTLAVYDDETGDLTSYLSVTAPASVTASGTGPVTKAAQGLMRLNTASIRNNRLVRGRIFMPGPATGQTTNGAPSTQYVEDMTTALQAAVTGAALVVWSRPRDGQSGATATVTSGTVWDQWAVLRSRRD